MFQVAGHNFSPLIAQIWDKEQCVDSFDLIQCAPEVLVEDFFKNILSDLLNFAVLV